ncbi:MAG: glycoside hydrolase family 3 protein [Dermatophilaceae bacterium]
MRPALRDRRTVIYAAGLALCAGIGIPAVATADPEPAVPTVDVAALTFVDPGATAELTVKLTAPVSSAVTVTWSAPDAGADLSTTSGSATFPAGSPAGAEQTLSVTAAAATMPDVASTYALQLGGVSPVGAAPQIVINASGFPYLDASLPVAARVDDLLGRMSLEEKVGQMTQAERKPIEPDPSQIATLKLGSLLSEGGSGPAENTPQAWADMTDWYQSQARTTRLQIPLIYGIDSVHGHGNLRGATITPHNVGLGATRDAPLVRDVQKVAATETRATGIPWVFAPCLCVARDDRWGRIYESFGEDPSLATLLGGASIDGLQGNGTTDLANPDRVLATAKHLAGDGDTAYGSGRDAEGANSSDYPIDQGITRQSRAAFEKINLPPFWSAVRDHKVGSVMPSYSSLDFTDDGLGKPVKMHANKAILQDWLKGDAGFGGFIISDYKAIEQIPLPTKGEQVAAWVNAGGDLAMEADTYKEFSTALLEQAKSGAVPQARIDDAVRRILTKKFELGLFEKPFTDRRNTAKVGSPENRAVARKAVAKSQVLLKNTGGVLPIKDDASVYVAGRNAADLGNQNGGWTMTWQGGSGANTTGTTIVQGMKDVAPGAKITYSADGSAPVGDATVGVVVVGETPYAEGWGDVGGKKWAQDPSDNGVEREAKSMSLQAGDAAVVDTVCAKVTSCVVLVVSGRPQVIGDRLGSIDALVASWLPGTEGAGVADVLFGRQPFSGRLPLSWPRTAEQQPLNVGDSTYDPLYPFGWGLTTAATGVAAPARSAAEQQLDTLRASAAQRADPATGVPAAASAVIAKADVAAIRGDTQTAISLLGQVKK